MRWLTLVCACCSILSAATVEQGPWSADYAPGQLLAVRYRGQVVVKYAAATGYLPEWKGARWGLGGAVPQVVQTAGRTVITYSLRQAGQVQGVVTLTLAGETASWRFEADVQPTGPVEFGLLLEPSGLEWSPGRTLLSQGQRDSTPGATAAAVAHRQISGEPHETEWDQRRFESFSTAPLNVFNRPERSLTWSVDAQPSNFVWQDHRAQNPAGYRLIITQPVADKARHLVAEAHLTVQDFDATAAAERLRRLGQRQRWSDPVPFANHGFEDGLTGWQRDVNGVVIDTGAKEGRRCSQLTVADPQKDAVYITRQVPVEGGGAYRVRTQVKTAGVVAKPGRMSSVGAGVILEWADRDGKWLAAGDYATGLFGDHDWTTRETRACEAPLKAGYAVIFLALRGAGQAWFDDVELVREHRALRLVEPAAATAADNTPACAWQEDPLARSYTVEWSRDQAFGAGTLRQASDVNCARPPRRLEPGLWFWRVGAPGYDWSAVWSFQQTVPVDRDTTPPTVTIQDARVTVANQPLAFTVTDESLPVKVAADVAGRPLAVTGGQGRFTVAGPWNQGLNTLHLTATDAAGNAVQVHTTVLCLPRPERAVVIGRDGTYQENGRTIFPLGMYQVSPQAMPTVKRAGFEVVHTYEFESSQNDDRARTYLDAAAANGLRVFLGFDRGNASRRGLVQGNFTHVQNRVAALCTHPGLFCWYLFDEPEVPGQVVVPRTLTRFADLIRRLDPFHPVVVTTWGASMNSYAPSFDTHWTQAYTTPDGVVRQLKEHRGYLGPDKPITLIAHCYDQQQSGPGRAKDPAKFEPDAAWLRAAAFAGLTQRVNGLWYWFYADGDKTWLTVSSVPAAWAGLSQVTSQIRSLEPVLCDAAPASSGETAGGALVWWRRTTAAGTTLIAVNTLPAPLEADLPAPGDGPVEVLFEQRSATRRNGRLHDSFGRYAVHVYRWR